MDQQQQQDNTTTILANTTIPVDYKRRMHEKWLQQQANALKQQIPPPLQAEEPDQFLSAASDEPTPLATDQQQDETDLAYAQQIQQELYEQQQALEQVRTPEPQYVRRLLPPRPTLWQSIKNWFLAAPQRPKATTPVAVLEEK